MRILLAEDDRMIGAAVVQALTDAAHAADWVTDGEAALTALAAQRYDLVLLDLGLPRRDGFEVLNALRAQHPSLPVLVITARDALDDRVRGLDLGADDYLIKPFHVRELLARMRALARRPAVASPPQLGNGTLTLDPVSREARYEGTASRLSPREFALLDALLRRPGVILSRSELETRIYGWNDEVDSNTIEVIIHAVRRKLGAAVIKNVRGVGWMVDSKT